MDRKRLTTLCAGFGAAALLAAVAFAAATQPPPAAAPAADDERQHGPPPGAGFLMPGLMPPGALEHLAKELGLTAEQRQTIKGFHEQAKPGFEQLRKQLRANAELLAKTRPDDAGYTTVVTNVSQSAGELATQLVLQGSRLRSQVFGVLNAEQKAKLVVLEGQRRERWHRPGAGAGGRPGPQ